jgi:hypothetical protein
MTLTQLFHRVPSCTFVDIASGYLNFPSFLVDLFLKRQLSMDVLTASPAANGFFYADGIKGLLSL